MQWFEDREQYTETEPVAPEIMRRFGEQMDLVRVYPNGMTQPGWNIKEYMENHDRGAFKPRRALRFYSKYDMPFGIIMRSVPLVGIDIDGKNGGIETANALRLTRSLAEVSKSNNGYHVVYEIPFTQWHELRGYDELPDLLGLVPGVDIKGTGILFHYPGQRWNRLPIAPLPQKLFELISGARDSRRLRRLSRPATSAATMDPDDLVILHDQLRTELNGKFVKGGRNQKLFALGAQMRTAGFPSWETALYDRGHQIGLDIDEVTSIIKNIEAYS
ncbi:DNA primase/polymerase [Microbacterium phage LilyLou]|uniref:DNA primase/polymerase n=1 Tax=Microbacterium phage LilyLou TaxID=2590876 RepID=A0A4Y6EBH6_9CAUD|nr:DNA primase/polymerase [Microbacterium phage LilyLou]